MNILISLHKGYGLGDCIQMSSVLRHVAKYRPEWKVVDYRAEEGRHCVGRGLVTNTFAYGEPNPTEHYDGEVLVCMYDTWANWQDRPNTRVSSVLHEFFDIPWDADCGRYTCKVSSDVRLWAKGYIGLDNAVAFHFKGDSSPTKKNLTKNQVINIRKHIVDLRMTPFVMGRHIPNGYDIEVNCALISECKAFIGIDSGPSKCASATDTPALVIWTGHHPAPFHDPAPNTTHLVPRGYHGLYPVCNDPGVIKWFEAHHSILMYDNDPVGEVAKWLELTLTN